MSAPANDKEWYEDWFDDTYLILYRHRSPAEARRLVQWLANSFRDRLPNSQALDLGCGAGRHAWAMSLLGWEVTGVDLSLTMLRHAREADEHETATADNASVGFVRGDLRSLPFADETFGLGLSAFTSFGYFRHDDEHRRALAEASRVMAAGGLLVLDLMNPETAISGLIPCDTVEESGLRAIQTRHYNPVAQRIEKHVRISYQSGETREVFESVRLFTQEEIAAFASEAGYDTFAWAGDYNGGEYIASESERMILLAWKRP